MNETGNIIGESAAGAFRNYSFTVFLRRWLRNETSIKHDNKASRPGEFGELTYRDLNKITRAVGEKVRAQTLEQKERLKRELLQEMELVNVSSARDGG